MLQAAIAALHLDEPQDWPQLAALYGELARLTGSSVVELNQAAAIAEAGDAEAALALVESIDLDHYHYLHATRAELLRRLDRVEDARAAYDRALELVHSEAERRFLERRLAELQDDNRGVEERRTSPVELLWDLVFVFAVTQVTTLLSRDLSWAGFGRGMLVLALVWWAWSAYVWAANAEQEESRVLRGVLLLGMVFIFIAGLSLPHAFGDRATLFACSYAGVRLLHLALYAHASKRGNASWSAIAGFGATVVIGMALLIAGSFLDEIGARRALDAGGGDRLRRPRLAHSRAASRSAAGGSRPLRRALQPVRDHLPGRVDRRDRPERERAADGRGSDRRRGTRPRSRPSASGGPTSTASPARRRRGSATTTTPCSRQPTATATSTS